MSNLMKSMYFIDAFPVNANPANPPIGFIRPAALTAPQVFNGFFSRSTNATAWIWNTPFASGLMDVGFHLPVDPIGANAGRGCAIMADPETGNGYAVSWHTAGLDVIIRSWLLTAWALSTQLSTATFTRSGFGNAFIAMSRNNTTGAMTIYRNATQLNSYTDTTYAPNYGGVYVPNENGLVRSIVITDLASVVVDSFNGGDDVERGQTGVPYSTTGLSAVTSITTNTPGITVSNISDTEGAGTCDVSGFVEAGLCPVFPRSVIFNLTGPEGSANITKTLKILPTESSVITSGLITLNNTFMGFHIAANGRSVADGGQFVWPTTPLFTLNGDGTWSYGAVGTIEIPVKYTDPANGRGYLFTATFGDGGIVLGPVMAPTASATVSVGDTAVGTYAATAGTAPIDYSLNNTDAGLFSVNASTAAVTFSPAADTPGVYTVGVVAENDYGIATTVLTVTVEAVVGEPTIDSVGAVRIGGTAVITVSGFDGTINAGTLDGRALVSANNTAIVMAALANGVNTYRPGMRPLFLTTGVKSDTVNVPVIAPSGWGYYEIKPEFVQAINGVAATYLPAGWAIGYFIFYPLIPSPGKTTTVGDDGVVSGNVGTQGMFLVHGTTGMATAFNVTTTGGAAAVGAGVTSASRIGALGFVANRF